jgi:peptidoglycan/LPS O-acetylase OafA/YrhL
MEQDVPRRVSLKESDFLNVLRGFAIIGVVAMHSMQVTDSLGQKHVSVFVSEIVQLGKYGVEVFFFLSGWLLTALYGLNKEPLPRSYAVRRFAKIFPLWVLFMSVYIILGYLANSGGFYLALNSESNSGITKRPEVIILLTLTFTLFLSPVLWNTVIPGGWSIQSEVAHYMLFPFIRRRRLKSVLLISAVTNFVSTIFVLIRSRIDDLSSQIDSIVATWLRLGLFSTFTFFLYGVLGRHFYLKLTQDVHQESLLGKELGLFVLSSFVVVCPMGVQIEAIGYLFINIFLAISLGRVVIIKTLLVQLGRYSYFIYFAHFLILQIIQEQLESNHFGGFLFENQITTFLLIFFMASAFSIILAKPSWKYIEFPLLARAK